MAWFSEAPPRNYKGPLLVVQDLHVFYGQAHVLQGISLSLSQGVLGIVGRNGMGNPRCAMRSPDWLARVAVCVWQGRKF
jgi:ABC-type histidine transport system ATPase subunit